MLSEDLHRSDQELLLAADGELPTDRAAQVHAHLAACWSCRARTAESKGQLLISRELTAGLIDPPLLSIAGPRALLRKHLAELASKREASSWRGLFQFT